MCAPLWNMSAPRSGWEKPLHRPPSRPPRKWKVRDLDLVSACYISRGFSYSTGRQGPLFFFPSPWIPFLVGKRFGSSWDPLVSRVRRRCRPASSSALPGTQDFATAREVEEKAKPVNMVGILTSCHAKKRREQIIIFIFIFFIFYKKSGFLVSPFFFHVLQMPDVPIPGVCPAYTHT